MIEGPLAASSNRGRYAISGATATEADLTGGQECEILLGGQWIAGIVEHTGGLYVDEDLPYAAHRGYYFADGEGNRVGLCIGMRVRIE